MRKKNLYWISQILGWSLYGFLQITLYSVQFAVDGQFIIGEVFQVILYILLTHILRYVIIRRKWLSIRWFALIPRVFLSTLLLAVVHYIFLIIISWITGNLNPSQDFNPLSILATMLISIGLFWVWSLIYVSFLYFERYNKSLQYEAAIKEIELSNLKSQLNPHFIFNALNGIRALVDENPKKSKTAITQLSNILRNSLSTQRKELIPFGEELSTVRDYLALESIRYEERLETSFLIDKASNQYQIPPLMLQTLVENGIKHGISHLKEGGKIEIKTNNTSLGLNIQIRNSGKFSNGNISSIGYGLLNTRKRLELIFGDEASFAIGDESEGVVLTEITIPSSK